MTYRVLFAALALSACQSSDDARNTKPYAGIDGTETIHFLGTEPFWGGKVAGNRLTYDTPENMDGTTFDVERFAGNNGVSFSGTLESSSFDMMVTEGRCSDGMSDRTYPFTVTLQIGEETRFGCAYTEAKPFDGPPAP